MVLVTTAACGGGSTSPKTTPSSAGSDTTPPTATQWTDIPTYGTKFEPLSQDVADPQRLLTALSGNYVRSVAAFTAGNTGLSQRYLLYIVGADGTAGAAYQQLFQQVSVDAGEAGYAPTFRSYRHHIASTYTLKHQRSSSRRVSLDVIEHSPGFPAIAGIPAANSHLTLVFAHQAKGKDHLGGRFVLTAVEPY